MGDNMRIALDFDGVLCDLKGIIRGHDFSKCNPKENAGDAIHWLIKEGHKVWIFTSREEKEWEDIKDWLMKWGFPKLDITNIKKKATIYLDDRGVRFTNWPDFCKLLG